MSAQDKTPVKPAKEMAEAASQADQVHARKIKKKQLQASPEVIAHHDSISIRSKKTPPVKNRNQKKIN